MICSSCGIEIDPKWISCIQKNECPQCSGPIMDEKAQQLLAELTVALTEIPNNPQGIANWLLSKYHIEKISEETPELPEFHEPKKRGSKKQGRTENEFMKRADVNLDPERAKKIMSYINDSQDSMYGADEVEPEDEVEDSEEDFELAQAMMGKKKKRPRREVPEYIGAPLAEGEDEAIQNMLGESEANLERLEKLAEQERRDAARKGNAKQISTEPPAFRRVN